MNEVRVGDIVEGNRITVTEYHVMAFAGLTGDFNPLHVDEEMAKNTNFKGRIVHGLFSLSLALGLVSQHIHEYFLYGFDKIRFTEPVRPGETVSSTLTVNGSLDRGKYTLYNCTLILKGSNESEVLNAVILLGKMKG